ncbi:MAG: sulfotransferase domain-containing protein [Deltaproteobacteria bacterium]
MRDYVTIVSGVPRSGTSMMLRMLAAGGLPVLTDGVRGADEDNPHGYLEWEGVKSLKEDASWVARAVGKAVKVIYHWLPALPLEFRYRVVFMQRDLDEVLASQSAMLERRGAVTQSPDDATMKRLFQEELREIDEWLRQRPSFVRLDVDYADVIADPRVQADRVSAFLGGELDNQAMADIVDPAMYRRRTI